MTQRYLLEIKPSALKAIDKLPLPIKAQVKGATESLKNNPRPAGHRKLSGGSGLYRIRSGDYRIIYAIEDQIITVTVVKVAHRKEVYRNL